MLWSCRHFVSLSLLVILTGCGATIDTASGPGVTCINPEEPVRYIRSSWKIEKGEEDEDLRIAQADDIFKALQPSEPLSNDGEAILDFMTDNLGTVSGIVGTSSNAESFENAIDLMEDMLAKDEVPNFITGRGVVLGCISEKVPHNYNNQDVQIGHEDGRASQGYIIEYRYGGLADEEGNEYLLRTILPSSSSTFDFADSYSVAYYDTKDFTSLGYNQPYSIENYWETEAFGLKLQKRFKGDFKDVLEYFNDDGISITESLGSIKRLRMEVYYLTGEVKIYMSSFRKAITGPDGQTIIMDYTDEELNELFLQNPDWNATVYEDPGYDGDNPAPWGSYVGTLVSHRGL